MPFDKLQSEIFKARDAATLRAVSEAFLKLAHDMEHRADRLEAGRNRPGRDLLTYLKAADYALALISHDIDEKRSLALSAAKFNVSIDTIETHVMRKRQKSEIEKSRARGAAVRDMQRRGLSQRVIARKLGISQSRVNQLSSTYRKQ